MSVESKNLGLVRAIQGGTTPPTNTLIIWADERTLPVVHRRYNPFLAGAPIAKWEPIGGINDPSLFQRLDGKDVALGYAGLDAGGKISLSAIPDSALERVYVYAGVATTPESAGLTTANVQNGDVVKMNSTGIMYVVKNDLALSSAGSFEVFYAGTAASTPWSGLTGAAILKPGVASVGGASLYIPTGVALTTPADGALEYFSSHLWFTIGSTRYQLDQQAGGGSGHTIQNSGSNLTTRANLNFTSGLTASDNSGAGSSDVKLGGTLTAPTTLAGSNTNILTFSFTTLAGSDGVTISSSNTDAASNTQKLFKVTLVGANGASTQTTHAGYFVNTHTGTNATNIALYAEASGGSGTGFNWAGFFKGGFWQQYDNLGVTPVNGAGNWLVNTTAATLGAQQISPSIIWEGQGNGSTTVNASQSVKFRAYTLPVQAATNPTATWVLSSSINGGSYVDNLTVSSIGWVGVNNGANTGRLGINTSPGGAVIQVLGISGTNAFSVQASNTATLAVISDQGDIQFGSTTMTNLSKVTVKGKVFITSNNLSSGFEPVLQVTPGTHTAIGNTAENINFDFLAATQTWAGGSTVAIQRNIYFRSLTVAAASSQAITDGYNVYIDPLIQGTNITSTPNRTYALGVAGNVNIFNSTDNAGLIVNDRLATLGGANGVSLRVVGQTGGVAEFRSAGGAGTIFSITNSGTISGGSPAFTSSSIINFSGKTTLTGNSLTSGWGPILHIIGGAFTVLPNSTESSTIVLNSGTGDLAFNSGGILAAGTKQLTWTASATVATQRDIYIRGTQYWAATSSTLGVTDGFTVYIDGPSAGTGTTLTNPYVLGLNGVVKHLTNSKSTASGVVPGDMWFNSSTGWWLGVPSLSIGSQIINARTSLTTGGVQNIIMVDTGSGGVGGVTVAGGQYYWLSGSTAAVLSDTGTATSTATQTNSSSLAFKNSSWTGAAATPGWWVIRAEESTSSNQINTLNFYPSFGASPTLTSAVFSISSSGSLLAGGFTWSNNILTLGLSTNSSTTQTITTLGSTTTPTNLVIKAMPSATTGIAGGSITINGGAATVGNASSGGITLQTLAGLGTAGAGQINLVGGNSGTGAGSFGADISIFAGSALAASTTPGSIYINGGSSSFAGITAGGVNINGGSGSGLGSATDGGFVTLQGGTGSLTGTGGVINIFGGNAVTNGSGGNITLQAGAGNGTGLNGSIIFQVGGGGSGNTPSIQLNSSLITVNVATVTMFNSTVTNLTFGGVLTTLNFGNAAGAQTINMFTASTASSTYNFATGVTAASNTKTINIGTGGAAFSTTNILLGATTGGTLTLNSPVVTLVSTPATNSTFATSSLMIREVTSGNIELIAPSGGGTTKFLRADGTWVAPAGGGGGISNTAGTNEMMKSDGTNAVSSGLFSTTAGDLDMGTGLAGAARKINLTGSAADIGLSVILKGQGVLTVSNAAATVSGNGLLDLVYTGADTNSVIRALFIERQTSGTAAAGLGFSISALMEISSGSGATFDLISQSWEVATAGSQSSLLTLEGYIGGGARNFIKVSPAADLFSTAVAGLQLGDGLNSNSVRDISTVGTVLDVPLTLTPSGDATVGIKKGLGLKTNVSSATSLTLNKSNIVYVFTGSSSTTWTLPPVGTTADLTYFIKNRGTANITLQKDAGDGSVIFEGAAQTSMTIFPGSAIIITSDGSIWNVM